MRRSWRRSSKCAVVLALLCSLRPGANARSHLAGLPALKTLYASTLSTPDAQETSHSAEDSELSGTVEAVLVTTADGTLFTLDPETGAVQSSVPADSPIASTFQDPKTRGLTGGPIVTSLHGELLVVNTHTARVERFGHIVDIVASGPAVSPSGVFVTGARTNSVLAVDISSGSVLFEEGGQGQTLAVPDGRVHHQWHAKPGAQSGPIVMYARTEYRVAAFVAEGSERREMWNATYSDLRPISARTQQHTGSPPQPPLSLQGPTTGQCRYRATPDGQLACFSASGRVQHWSTFLGSPVAVLHSMLSPAPSSEPDRRTLRPERVETQLPEHAGRAGPAVVLHRTANDAVFATVSEIVGAPSRSTLSDFETEAWVDQFQVDDGEHGEDDILTCSVTDVIGSLLRDEETSTTSAPTNAHPTTDVTVYSGRRRDAAGQVILRWDGPFQIDGVPHPIAECAAGDCFALQRIGEAQQAAGPGAMSLMPHLPSGLLPRPDGSGAPLPSPAPVTPSASPIQWALAPFVGGSTALWIARTVPQVFQVFGVVAVILLVVTLVSSKNSLSGKIPSPTPLSEPLELQVGGVQASPTFQAPVAASGTPGMSILSNTLRLSTLPEDRLGKGATGAVFRGWCGEREVAVKRIDCAEYNDTTRREIDLLTQIDGHKNMIRYFTKEEAGGFVYLALELCGATLASLCGRERIHINSHRGRSDRVEVPPICAWPRRLQVKFLGQIAEGMSHLFDLNIVHFDVKPANVLVAVKPPARRRTPTPGTTPVPTVAHLGTFGPLWQDGDELAVLSLVPKISDMGLGRTLSAAAGTRSFVSVSQRAGAGTIGWQSPEVLQHAYDRLRGNSGGSAERSTSSISDASPTSSRQDQPLLDFASTLQGSPAADIELRCSGTESLRITRSADVFPLGCLFYYTLTGGEHPFGHVMDRTQSILRGESNLAKLDDWPEMQHLIAAMLHPDPAHRPTARQVSQHPVFWSLQRRQSLLQDTSNALERLSLHSPVARALEVKAESIVGSNWRKRLDPELQRDLENHRAYNFGRVADCLRMTRNKQQHFGELPISFRSRVKDTTALSQMFQESFPRMLLACWQLRHAFSPSTVEGLGDDVWDWETLDVAVYKDTVLIGRSESRADHTQWYPCEQAWCTSTPLRPLNEPPRPYLVDKRYKTRLCDDFARSKGMGCPRGARCDFAHTIVELRSRSSRVNWSKVGNAKLPSVSHDFSSSVPPAKAKGDPGCRDDSATRTLSSQKAARPPSQNPWDDRRQARMGSERGTPKRRELTWKPMGRPIPAGANPST